MNLFGAGPFTSNNPGNDVTAVAGVIADALSYTDANALTIGTPGLGLATANAPVTIATIDGDLTSGDFLPIDGATDFAIGEVPA